MYRITNLTPEQIARYVPGSTVTDPAFTSSSTSPDHMRAERPNSNTEFEIESLNGRAVPESAIPGETEVLFDRNTRFEVVSSTTDPVTGKTLIKLKEVP